MHQPVTRKYRFMNSQHYLPIALFALMLSGCEPSFDFRPLSGAEKIAFTVAAQEYEGVPYGWDGQSIEGVDCSGLIVLAMNAIGFEYFFNGLDYVEDITADQFFSYNTYAIEEPKYGDLIFFDADGDGIKEHVSIFMSWAENGNAIVFDAYSVSGFTGIREVADFQSKNPVYGELIGFY